MYRVLSMSSLDLRREESVALLEYLLLEAAEMRSYRSTEL